MDLATLSEAARSLGPSPGPPKPSLPPPPRAMKPDPFLPPPMHPTPEAVHQQSPSDAQTNLQGALFSPLFQCATTLPFYAALLNELQAMATLVDPCPAVVREIIWEHVFLLIGVQPHRCDLSLKPIIEAWLSAPTVNLLAVELLYIAFVRALANHPDLLRAQTQNVVRGPNFPPSAPAPAAAQQSSTTFVQRPFKRYTGAEVQTPQPTKQKPAFFENETTMLNSKYLTPPNANPVTATEVYFLLDTMPHEARDALHTLLRAHPSFASMREWPIFSAMTATWAAEPVRHFEAAALLFLAVGFLKAIKKVPIECFDPRRMLPVFSSGDELANLSFKKYVTISQHDVS